MGTRLGKDSRWTWPHPLLSMMIVDHYCFSHFKGFIFVTSRSRAILTNDFKGKELLRTIGGDGRSIVVESSAEVSHKPELDLHVTQSSRARPSYQRAACTHVLPAALPVETEIQRQPRYLSMDTWIKK